jgi:endonuclease YncB( thermonuclease family)
VICRPASLDPYGRTLATYSVGVVDLGEWLVRRCLALDWPHYSQGRYGATQTVAERTERGIWAGSYLAPWLFGRAYGLAGVLMTRAPIPESHQRLCGSLPFDHSLAVTFRLP